MVFVVLLDGRVLQYNRCHSYQIKDGYVEVNLGGGKTGNIASIPLEHVHRVEFEKPCAIYDKKGKGVKINY